MALRQRLAVLTALAGLAAGCGRTSLGEAAGIVDASGSGSVLPDGMVPTTPTDAAAPPADASSRGPEAGPEASSVLDAALPEIGAPRVDAGCGPSTCPTSCCLPDGTCAPVENNEACGSGGTACKACDPGEYCKGVCVQDVADCTAASCPGCCVAPTICAAGDSDYACGRAGDACQRCLPSEGTGSCVPQAGGGGSCTALAACSPNDCTGCCAGDVCLFGDEDDACGTGGKGCAACTGSQTCTFDTTGEYGAKGQYVCATTSPCGPATCSGCCDGLVCAEGAQDVACGTGGAACADCQSAGQTCAQGVCR